MRLLALLLIVATAIAAGCASAPPPASKPNSNCFFCATGMGPPKNLFPPPSVNVEAARRLTRAIPLETRDYTLKQFVELIEQACEVDVQIDWDGLKQVGVDQRTRLSVKEGRPPADRDLSMILWVECADQPDRYPTFMIADGVVVIGTNASLVRHLPQVNWPKRDDPSLRGGENEAVRLKLQKVISPPNDSLSLGQVVAFIRDQTRSKIEINWRALEVAGIDQDTLVVISVKHLTAGMLLQEALEQASSDAFDGDKAEYQIHDGKVHISTRRDLFKSRLSTRGYDISDLLMYPYGPTLASVYEDDPFALLLLRDYDLSWRARWSDHDHARYGPVDRKTLSVISDYDRNHIQDEFRYMIESIGDTDHWLDEEWDVNIYDGTMVVRTSDSVHRHIETLLTRLRDNRRATVLRFMRELEAARLLKRAEQARQAGETEKALELIDQAHRYDPGNDIVWAMRRMLGGEGPTEAGDDDR